MKLYIIRHGETRWNVEGRLQGQTDISLAANGIRLAQECAARMRDIPFDFGITSPLSRARETAEIILNGRDVPLHADRRIMELSFGAWEGLSCRQDNFEIPSEHFGDFFERPLDFVPGEGGETVGALLARTADFYEELIARPEYADKTILIATHGCAMRALLHGVYGAGSDFWHGSVPKNCAVNIVEVTDGVSRLIGDDILYYDQKDGMDYYGSPASPARTDHV